MSDFLDNFELVGRVADYCVAVIWFSGLGLRGNCNKLMLGAPVRC
jgi:hypothetical protein